MLANLNTEKYYLCYSDAGSYFFSFHNWILLLTGPHFISCERSPKFAFLTHSLRNSFSKLYYLYVYFNREIFKLPHASSLTKWLGSVNAEPGFFTKVFDAAKKFPDSERDINLVLDGMAIKKHLQWDSKTQKFLGYCDFGEEIFLDRPETEATEALVFMIVSLRGQWKWPVGTYKYLIFIAFT